ncbi:transposase [bacterium]|nr:transposase [bacterium]
MATRHKIFLTNEIYFLTFTILDWKNIFTEEKYFNLIYKWFDYMKDKYDNKIHGYVIMPNHIHLLLKVTSQSQSVPKIIQNAKRFLAYEIVRYLKEDEKQELLKYFKERARIENKANHKIFKDGYDSLII